MSPQPTSIAASPLHVRGRQHSHSVWRRAREVPLATAHQVATKSCPPGPPRFIRAPHMCHQLCPPSWQVKSILWHSMGMPSCLCERGRRCCSNTRLSSAARAPHRTSADCPRGTSCARHLRTPRAACQRAHWNESTRCVVWCLIDGRERAWKLI